MIVVDTNVIAYFLIPGDYTESARAALRKDSEWAAPLLWRSEFRNVLALFLYKDQLSDSQALRIMQEAESLMRGREYEVPSAQVLSSSAASGCVACDCEFVALAQELGIPLVTSDSQVLAAFPDATVSLREFGSRR